MFGQSPIFMSHQDGAAAQEVVREAGLRSDGELVQAVSEGADGFEFRSGGAAGDGGFSDVSGLGAEVTVAEARGGAHTPEWSNPSEGDPGRTAVSSDPEWRYVAVRRFGDDEDQDMGFHWGEDGLF
ncbi:hypothetical protein [Antarctobacter jejuensis]|uniref:hypothetical protein n=1 Tax=Antarctobacter jejuensis TaxID=1439938 RepID=UPI003FD65174